MNKLFLIIGLSIPYSLSAVHGVLSCTGTIDKKTNFSMSFDSSSNFGLVEFYSYENGPKNPTKISETLTIQNVAIDGKDEWLRNNNLTITTGKGTFYVPNRKSKDSALFNDQKITLISAEDINRMAYPELFK